jgi:ankyrin repeat protein
MKYIKLYEDFEEYNPYDLMVMFSDERLELFFEEIKKNKPNLNLVGDLINLGTINVQNEYGITPLHLATEYCKVEIVKMLIDAGADVNVQNIWNNTSLHRAALYGEIDIARILIDAGARKDIRDEDDRIPYDLARTPELKNLLKP